MTKYFHYRSLTANHVAKSIIVTQYYRRPDFMSSDRLSGNSWPTPATTTYQRVVSKALTDFFWRQGDSKRRTLLNSVTRELYCECGGRVYRRMRNSGDILVRQTLQEFEKIVQKRFDNLRYDTSANDGESEGNFEYVFSNFSQGEQVLVESRSSLTYPGSFEFNSIINSRYCYIDFDSRNEPIRWERRLVKAIDTTENRRITRSMARNQRRNEEAESVEIEDQGTGNDVFTLEDLPGGASFENLKTLRHCPGMAQRTGHASIVVG